jgi:hypothetical protein
MKTSTLAYNKFTMKLTLAASILLLACSNTCTYAVPQNVDGIVEPLNDKEKLVGRWVHQRDETIGIYFKWDGRLIYTEWLRSPEGKIFNVDHYGEWSLKGNVITMTFKRDTFKQYVKIHDYNSFSLITDDDVRLYKRVKSETPFIRL